MFIKIRVYEGLSLLLEVFLVSCLVVLLWVLR